VVELTLQVTINNGRRREVKYRQSQEVLVDIPERITEHGLSSEITQSLGGSSNMSEGSGASRIKEDQMKIDSLRSKCLFGMGRAVGHNSAVWQELNNISLALFVVLNCLVIRCVILCRGCYIPNKWYQEPRFEKKESYNLEEAITRRIKTLCLSQEVLVDIPERITEHGLSSEITQSSGGSSDTSVGSENSGSFEGYGSSGEGLML
ncbi:hypothetical protein Tco_1544974, partial [Tanacetum coccineum]